MGDDLMSGDESGIEINDNDNIGMFWSRNKKQTPQIVDDESNNEYVLEKNGDDFDEQAYEDTEHEQIDEVIPEEPIKKEKTKVIWSSDKNEKTLKYSKTAKVSEEENEQLEYIKDAYGLNDAGALKWCLKRVWETQGEEVKSIAKKIRRIRNKQ